MSEYNVFDYVPIAIMFLVAAGFGVSQLLVTQLIGPRKRTAVKLMPYECGKDPVGSARDKYSIKFYVVAVVFLLFDIEVLFIIPFRCCVQKPAGRGKTERRRIRHDRVCRDSDICGDAGRRLYLRLEKRHFRLGIQARAEAREEAKAMAKRRRDEAANQDRRLGSLKVLLGDSNSGTLN